MKIKRQPIIIGRKSIIIGRKSILTDGEKYCTMASMDYNYQGVIEIMATYPDYKTAKRYYTEDINNQRGRGFKAYYISLLYFKGGKVVKKSEVESA